MCPLDEGEGGRGWVRAGLVLCSATTLPVGAPGVQGTSGWVLPGRVAGRRSAGLRGKPGDSEETREIP